MRGGDGAKRWGGWALAAAVALWALNAPGERGALTDDERDYAQAAIHLLRHGVFSHAPGLAEPAPDAYREPGYAAFVAAVWKLSGVAPPERPEDLVKGVGDARRAVARLGAAQRLLLAAAAWAAVLAARRLGGGRVAASSAGLLTLASPALLRCSGQLASEALAAALLAFAAVALAALVAAPTARRAVLAGLLLGGLALTRAAFAYLLPLFVLAPLLGAVAEGRRGRRRAGLAALLAGSALVLPAAWMARNVHQFGHATLSESRVVPLARVELAADLAREGRWAAALEWTPGGLARGLHRRWFPQSGLDRWRWSGPPEQANYFVRAVHRRRALLAGGMGRLEADAALRREALAAIRERPGEYLLSLPPLLWRGLFAERSPGWAHPFDLGLPLGLLLATGFAVALGRAVAVRDGPRLALLSLPALSYLLHALATEQLPRFHQPALPLAWAAVAVAGVGWAGGSRGRASRTAAGAVESCGRAEATMREHRVGGVELVVLLDESGEPAGTAPKSEVHHAGTPLHLAFSLFLFDREGRTLLQRRSLAKRTWPGVWSNGCCGHPGPGEEVAAAARRRLAGELGLDADDLEVILPAFRYRAEHGGIVENEVCPVLAGRVRGTPRPDPSEVAEIAWHPWQEVVAMARENPERLSPWAAEETRLLAESPAFAAWWRRALPRAEVSPGG